LVGVPYCEDAEEDGEDYGRDGGGAEGPDGVGGVLGDALGHCCSVVRELRRKILDDTKGRDRDERNGVVLCCSDDGVIDEMDLSM
jgi:hypothetical protein